MIEHCVLKDYAYNTGVRVQLEKHSSTRKPVEAPKKGASAAAWVDARCSFAQGSAWPGHNDRETKKCGVAGRTMLHGACMTVRSANHSPITLHLQVRAYICHLWGAITSAIVRWVAECGALVRLRELEMHPGLDLVQLVKVGRKVQDVKATLGCATASGCRRSANHSRPSSLGVQLACEAARRRGAFL